MNGNEKSSNTPGAGGRNNRLRRLAAICAAPAVVIAGLAASPGTANADVGPYVRESVQWGDCTIVLGTVPDAYDRAYGGTDVSCGHYYSNINIKVDLWRLDGGRWTLAASSGWQSASDTYRFSAVTAPYSVPGCRHWDISTTVNVGGYQTSHDYVQDVSKYNSPGWLGPTWNPTVGNCDDPST